MSKQDEIIVITVSNFQITESIDYQSKRKEDVKELKRVLKMCLQRFGFPECLKYIECYNNNFVRINGINYNGFDKEQVIEILQTLNNCLVKS